MSGKGDTRRPAAIPGDTLRTNWDRTFPPVPLPPDDDLDAWMTEQETAALQRALSDTTPDATKDEQENDTTNE